MIPYLKNLRMDPSLPYLYLFEVGFKNPIKNGCQMTLSFNSSIGFMDIPTILRGIDGSEIYWDIKDAFL